MPIQLHNREVFGLIRPNIDAHTLGVSNIAKLLEECGYKVIIGDSMVAEAVAEMSKLNNIDLLVRWLDKNKITSLGFSYRLDPKQAQNNFGKVYHQIKSRNLTAHKGGKIKKIFFAGLPEACRLVQKEYQGEIETFMGDETPLETLTRIGVPLHIIPDSIQEGTTYDDSRWEFAKKVIERKDYIKTKAADRSGYKTFGSFSDNIIERIQYAQAMHQHPLMRVHVGPYNPNYMEAVKEFTSWIKQLAQDRFLDIVSIGSSQLSQSHFGEDWKDLPNGGGVPINSSEEYHKLWQAGRPMLFRTYAGTRNIPGLARIYEMSMNICWHALSFWWFCQIDGRGPNSVMENLHQHIETLKFIAESNKPFEPNIPHHFAFRGGDDVSYVVAAYLAAKTAKKNGVKTIVLQNMLNTPKYTWGIQDLAKSRVMLRMLKSLEDNNFKIILQARAGLDYFSPDMDKAKIQLASVSALMDDIDPDNTFSPEIIHVVSYSEASHLATPDVIKESIQITIQAINDYRKLRDKDKVENMALHSETNNRTEELFNEVNTIIESIENSIPDPYSATGLYKVFASGFLVVPYLWEGKEEFENAIKWSTALIKGSVKIVDNSGSFLPASKRLPYILEDLRQLKIPV